LYVARVGFKFWPHALKFPLNQPASTALGNVGNNVRRRIGNFALDHTQQLPQIAIAVIVVRQPPPAFDDITYRFARSKGNAIGNSSRRKYERFFDHFNLETNLA